MVLVFF